MPIEYSRPSFQRERPFPLVPATKDFSDSFIFSGLHGDSSIWEDSRARFCAATYLPYPVDIAYNQYLSKTMYFFDQVFPHQHHFYQPDHSIPDQGRGWLLAMILRTNHYHLSTLAISALHQNLFIDRRNVEQSKRSVETLEECHYLAVSDLQQELNRLLSLTGLEYLTLGLGMLASMIQLVSFEVRGPNSN